VFFQTAKTPPTYFLIDSLKKLEWLKKSLLESQIFSADLESNWPTSKTIEVERDYPEAICGVSFAWGRTGVQVPWTPGTAAYLPLTTANDDPFWKDKQDYVISVLKEILESPVPKVFQNGKFDVSKFFSLLDIRTEAFLYDTMLMAGLIDEDKKSSSHALKSEFDEAGNIVKLGLSDHYLGEETSLFKEDLKSALLYYDPHYRRYSKVPIDILYPYGCADADLTLSLMFVLKEKVDDEGMMWLHDNIVMPMCHTLISLELYGMPVDIERANQVVSEQTAIMNESQKEVWGIIGREFNVGSNDQLGKILFDELGLPGEKTEFGKWKVDVENITGLNHPIIEPVLKYRRAQKVGSTYAQGSLNAIREVTDGGKIGWLHESYFQNSRTGRLRCQEPNLTNLPRPENGGDIVKSLYLTPPDYWFIFMDWAQIEIRIAAHLSGEPVWVNSVSSGIDLHNLMAKLVYKLPCDISEVKKLYPEQRTAVKSINFGILYGESEYALSKKLGITFDEAYKLVNEDYFGAAPTLRSWIDSVHDFVKTNGYVTNMFGRVRHIPEATIPIPEYLPWPPDASRPRCYREGPYLSWLGIDPADMYDVGEFKIKQLINSRGRMNQFTHCISCPYIKSCMVNREVKYVKAQVGRALRQAVNTPIQGSAADLSFLSFTEIAKTLKSECVDSHPALHIHDEVICIAHSSEVEKTKKIMQYYMTDWAKEAVGLSVPLDVDIAVVQRWSDKYDE
jgi:DNA polymerase I-like protein with 3'-5' exonuclease and polymerase domains